MTSPARTIVVPAVSIAPSPFAFLFPGSLQRWPMAEPDDVLDYSLDVSAPLSDVGDTIASASVSISPSGIGELSAPSVEVDGTLITAWLSGGVAGRSYTIKVEAITDGGRTFEWLLGLPIDPWLANYPLPRSPSMDFGEPVSSEAASANASALVLLF